MEKIVELQIKTLDNVPIDLMKEYANSPLLIIFFNIRCLGCVGRAIPLAYKFMQEYEGLKVAGIHVSFGNETVTKNDIINIFTTPELPFPIYFDVERNNYQKFECEGTPHWLLITKEGYLFRTFFGSQEGAQTRLMYALDELVEEL